MKGIVSIAKRVYHLGLIRNGNQIILLAQDQDQERGKDGIGMILHTDKELQELKDAQARWAKLADDEESMARFYEDNGKLYGSTDIYQYRADVYRRVVQALQIQIETGIAVCSCCFKPFGGSDPYKLRQVHNPTIKRKDG